MDDTTRTTTRPTPAASIAVAALMVLLAACAPQGSREGSEIAALSSGWEEAVNAGDIETLVSMYTEDCRLMPPGSGIREGREAVRETFEGMHSAGLTADLETVETRIAGDIGSRVGTYTVRDAAGGPVETGKFVELWRRVDGEWRISDDIWNSDSAHDGGELVVITHRVRDRDRWLEAWSGEDSRRQLFLDNGAAEVTVMESVDTAGLTGLVVRVSDMNAFHAMMIAPGTSEAKIADGVEEEGFHVFSEVE